MTSIERQIDLVLEAQIESTRRQREVGDRRLEACLCTHRATAARVEELAASITKPEAFLNDEHDDSDLQSLRTRMNELERQDIASEESFDCCVRKLTRSRRNLRTSLHSCRLSHRSQHALLRKWSMTVRTEKMQKRQKIRMDAANSPARRLMSIPQTLLLKPLRVAPMRCHHALWAVPGWRRQRRQRMGAATTAVPRRRTSTPTRLSSAAASAPRPSSARPRRHSSLSLSCAWASAMAKLPSSSTTHGVEAAVPPRIKIQLDSAWRDDMEGREVVDGAAKQDLTSTVLETRVIAQETLEALREEAEQSKALSDMKTKAIGQATGPTVAPQDNGDTKIRGSSEGSSDGEDDDSYSSRRGRRADAVLRLRRRARRRATSSVPTSRSVAEHLAQRAKHPSVQREISTR